MKTYFPLRSCTQKFAENYGVYSPSLRFIKGFDSIMGCVRAYSDRFLSEALFLLRYFLLHVVFSPMTQTLSYAANSVNVMRNNSSSGGSIIAFAAFLTTKLQGQFLEIRGLNLKKEF